ncbi:NUDIX domain-containing protein [Williamsia sterculiae]|uniref:Predicted NTP pyrophosphohydrolase, NUDIX family n=1 Tax=Williamsia sterculiae TaxID=1344003 RepID=A0A1N7DFH5_9NOCA|nr:NUDIX domain-containing protein [Williamsia sterculiae]SIR74629.1 Predicted NTP pyrophosphohydrolase, NUDIX family [Williamsia sterculiae]
MAKRSAGLLLHRDRGDGPELLIAHPGGPLWARKDDGAWSIPKGEYGPDEDALTAARREFAEEVGLAVPAGPVVPLGEERQRSGKIVTVFALAADLDITDAHSNTFEMEWPRGSGRLGEFPEVDRVAWTAADTATAKLVSGQRVFVERLLATLG